MGISVESRVHRTLRKLKRFRPCRRWDQLPQLGGVYSPLVDTEKLFGVYENRPCSVDLLLLFTDLGVHIWEGIDWRSIRYADIANTEWPTEAKDEAHALILRTKAGHCERLPILGGTEFTRDLFSVMTFFDRVIDDIKKELSGS